MKIPIIDSTERSRIGFLLCLLLLTGLWNPTHALATPGGMAMIFQQQVSGTIYDDQRQPLPGASVMEQGTSNSTITDADGKFSLTLTSTSPVLVISYMGFLQQQVVVNGDTVEVLLVPDVTTLEDVVVIGYGKARAKDLTGAVSTVDLNKTRSQPVADLGQAIQGRAAGVQVYSSGEPGSNVTQANLQSGPCP